jgi:hypothetical protein
MASDYCTRAQLRSFLDLEADAVTDDTLLDAMVTRASRAIDRFTGRWFYELSATRDYDHPGNSAILFLKEDLLSLTTLTIDGSVTTNYVVYPLNTSVKGWIEAKKGTGTIFHWTNTPQEAVAIAGLWGWHNDYGNAWGALDTVQDDPLASSATVITVADAHKFAVRQTIKMGDEQCLITRVDKNNEELTVSRAHNGTTAAEHVQTTAISGWIPPADIVHQCARLASWYYDQKDAPFGRQANLHMGISVEPLKIPHDVEAALLPYRRVY